MKSIVQLRRGDKIVVYEFRSTEGNFTPPVIRTVKSVGASRIEDDAGEQWTMGGYLARRDYRFRMSPYWDGHDLANYDWFSAPEKLRNKVRKLIAAIAVVESARSVTK